MWDRFRDKEMDRIFIAEDLLIRYAKFGNILEIECGEGISNNQIKKIFTHFLGVLTNLLLQLRKQGPIQKVYLKLVICKLISQANYNIQ